MRYPVVLGMIFVLGAIGFAAWQDMGAGDVFVEYEPVQPNWMSIAAWPPATATSTVADVDATPDPARNFTVIVLDDSGSMSDEIADAKSAVLASLESMGADDRISVVALNAGEVISFSTVNEARQTLPRALMNVRADGNTPLTGAVRASRRALELEAAVAGGFGNYRVLVTTDGQADEPNLLTAEVEDIARNTPIQIATIGVGIRGNHVLRRSDLAAFVAIDNVGELAGALKSAIAEEQVFSAITTFGE